MTTANRIHIGFNPASGMKKFFTTAKQAFAKQLVEAMQGK
jgi:hypothetical protein